jgi:hypothetical protein
MSDLYWASDRDETGELMDQATIEAEPDDDTDD